jgi:D-tyrosyl-tRNA(Tyr) deacylase
MITVVQRVSQASVTIDSRCCSEIGEGLLILVGVGKGDIKTDAEELAGKITHLRIFGDEKGRMNRSLMDIQGSALVVSQFTLLADTSRGRRPGFDDAAPPDQAEALYNHFVEKVRVQGINTQTGVFGAFMQVQLINNGPVTLLLQNKKKPSREA